MLVLKLRSAPIIKNILTSAVASSTAVGTLETSTGGERALQASTSIWSYPAPVGRRQYRDSADETGENKLGCNSHYVMGKHGREYCKSDKRRQKHTAMCKISQ